MSFIFESRTVDIREAMEKQQQPVIVMKRAESVGERHTGFLHADTLAGKTWCVASSPLPDDGSEVDWSLVKSSEHVRVPLFGYVSVERTWPSVIGAAFQRGFTMAAGLPQGERIAKLLLLVGAVFEGSVTLPDGQQVDGMEFWLGAAARLDS